jgi:hypothetical protein
LTGTCFKLVVKSRADVHVWLSMASPSLDPLLCEHGT